MGIQQQVYQRHHNNDRYKIRCEGDGLDNLFKFWTECFIEGKGQNDREWESQNKLAKAEEQRI